MLVKLWKQDECSVHYERKPRLKVAKKFHFKWRKTRCWSLQKFSPNFFYVAAFTLTNSFLAEETITNIIKKLLISINVSAISSVLLWNDFTCKKIHIWTASFIHTQKKTVLNLVGDFPIISKAVWKFAICSRQVNEKMQIKISSILMYHYCLIPCLAGEKKSSNEFV